MPKTTKIEKAASTKKKTLIGKIVSDKMLQSAVIQVAVWKTNRVIKKRYQRHHRFMAHNPDNTYKTGDIVEIVETKPMSRNKHWLILRKVDLHKNTTKTGAKES